MMLEWKQWGYTEELIAVFLGLQLVQCMDITKLYDFVQKQYYIVDVGSLSKEGGYPPGN